MSDLVSELEVAGRREDDAAKSFFASLDREHVGGANRVCSAILQDATLGTELLALRHAYHLDCEIQGSNAPSLGNQGEAGRRCGNVAGGAHHGGGEQSWWSRESFVERKVDCHHPRCKRH